uniref:Uncharacterized protein n=1 Tax=Arundo donax TaxID=35708 RepID=A0A0A9AL03_ARUDO
MAGDRAGGAFLLDACCSCSLSCHTAPQHSIF